MVRPKGSRNKISRLVEKVCTYEKCDRVFKVHPYRDYKTGNYCSVYCRNLALVKTGSESNNYRHGFKRHPSYDRWRHMMNRCYQTTNHDYVHYGGRGIEVCEEWQDLVTFCVWLDENLGPRPPGWSLDRINNDGNYEPGNVRWADHSTQMKNRRNTRSKL